MLGQGRTKGLLKLSSNASQSGVILKKMLSQPFINWFCQAQSISSNLLQLSRSNPMLLIKKPQPLAVIKLYWVYFEGYKFHCIKTEVI